MDIDRSVTSATRMTYWSTAFFGQGHANKSIRGQPAELQGVNHVAAAIRLSPGKDWPPGHSSNCSEQNTGWPGHFTTHMAGERNLATILSLFSDYLD
jgi:hypothetical protein